MIYRVIILLGCAALFINGCNNLISGVAGTHKLRSYAMQEVLEVGIGDADFIQIGDAWSDGNYLFLEPAGQFRKPLWLFPLYSEEQLSALDRGEAVAAKLIAWTEKLDPDCVSRGDCLQRGKIFVKGIIAGNRRVRGHAGQLTPFDNPIYLQQGRPPLAWYWNALMLIGALGTAYLLERRNFNRA